MENERTTLTISISAEDKKRLKIIAAEQGTTISAVIHKWIERNEKEGRKNGE